MEEPRRYSEHTLNDMVDGIKDDTMKDLFLQSSV